MNGLFHVRGGWRRLSGVMVVSGCATLWSAPSRRQLEERHGSGGLDCDRTDVDRVRDQRMMVSSTVRGAGEIIGRDGRIRMRNRWWLGDRRDHLSSRTVVGRRTVMTAPDRVRRSRDQRMNGVFHVRGAGEIIGRDGRIRMRNRCGRRRRNMLRSRMVRRRT